MGYLEDESGTNLPQRGICVKRFFIESGLTTSDPVGRQGAGRCKRYG